MAPEKASLVAEVALLPPPPPQPVALAPPSTADHLTVEPARANSLKRPRDTTPTSPLAVSPGQPELSPAKFARLVDSTRFTPASPLTGQAALEDEQRRREEEARLYPPDAVSDNPALKALAALRGAAAMSRANEVSATAQAAADAAAANKVVDPVAIPSAGLAAAENNVGTSPQSATSGQSLGSGHHVVHSPAPMDVDSRNDQSAYPQPEAQMEDKAVSMSYPGILPPGAAMGAPPQRGMSLPGHPSQNPDLAPRSPSTKKHKCPYCETEFTRHHNLKSHLLTHSQEKPFLCQDCQMRFRRLHDLKRHSKLHTGEKPHICPKCDRKFARGDALARHGKGIGGCAGRRSSMGSFAGEAEDDYDEAGATDADDSNMTGVIYDASDADMTEADRRRLSLPSIKAQHVAGGPAGADSYTPQSRTYPPAGSRGTPAGGLYPPHLERVPATASSTSPSLPSSSSVMSSHTPSTSISSVPMSAGGASLFSHGMTESPRPLSPGGLQSSRPGQDSAHAPPLRSPSLTAQLQHQLAGRRQSQLAAPHTATHTPANVAALASAPLHQGNAVGTHSRDSSGPPQGHSGGSGDSSANLFSSGEGVWAYIQALETRLQQQDEKVRLQEDKIAALESQSTRHEAQILYLTEELQALHDDQPPPPRPQDPLEPPASKS